MTHVQLPNCLKDALGIAPKPKQSLLPRQGVPVFSNPLAQGTRPVQSN